MESDEERFPARKSSGVLGKGLCECREQKPELRRLQVRPMMTLIRYLIVLMIVGGYITQPDTACASNGYYVHHPDGSSTYCYQEGQDIYCDEPSSSGTSLSDIKNAGLEVSDRSANDQLLAHFAQGLGQAINNYEARQTKRRTKRTPEEREAYNEYMKQLGEQTD